MNICYVLLTSLVTGSAIGLEFYGLAAFTAQTMIGALLVCILEKIK